MPPFLLPERTGPTPMRYPESPRDVHRACIGLGSNLGDSRRLLCQGWQAIGQVPGINILSLSAPYRTAPVDMDSGNWFINAAGLLETSLGPRDLLEHLLAVEQRFGRSRSPDGPGHQDRTLDLDLLLFDRLVLERADLALPHPRMHKRLFVLAPLAEIAPKYYHPVLKKTVWELFLELRNTTRPGEVERTGWRDAVS